MTQAQLLLLEGHSFLGMSDSVSVPYNICETALVIRDSFLDPALDTFPFLQRASESFLDGGMSHVRLHLGRHVLLLLTYLSGFKSVPIL